MVIKHKDMMAQISSWEEFDCVYLKSDGSLTEFKRIRKLIKSGESTGRGDRRRKSRALQSYLLLLPFITPNEDIRELYTRLIVKFNGDEVSL